MSGFFSFLTALGVVAMIVFALQARRKRRGAARKAWLSLLGVLVFSVLSSATMTPEERAARGVQEQASTPPSVPTPSEPEEQANEVPTAPVAPDTVLEYARDPEGSGGTLESVEEGRHVYRFGNTPLGEETSMVWYSPENWWLQVRTPHISREVLGPMSELDGNGVATRYEITTGPLAEHFALENAREISVYSSAFFNAYLR